jgi:hypothetical protein
LNSKVTLLLFLCCFCLTAGTAAYIMDAPPMFTFHHVNAFTTAAPGSSNGNGSRRKQQLVLDTVAWDEVAFENNQVCGGFTIHEVYSQQINQARALRPKAPRITLV